MRHPESRAAMTASFILLTAVAPLAFLLGGPFAWVLLALSAPLLLLVPIGVPAPGASTGHLVLSPCSSPASSTPVSANAFAPRPPPAFAR